MLELLVGLLRDEFTEAAPGTRRMDLKTRLQQISAGGSNLAIDERLEADLRLHLGRAFLSLRDFVRAENEATRCVDLASHEGLDDPLLVFRGALLLAAIERESGDFVRSRATLAELHNRILLLEATAGRRKLDSIEVASLHAEHALETGLTALALGEADQAVASLNESIDRSPARSVGHIAIVNAARTAKIDALLALGRPRDAELLAHELLATLVSSDAMLSAALSSESELVRASRRRLDELTRRLGRPVRDTRELPPLTAERRAVDNTDKN